MVDCPLCNRPVRESHINEHIDSGCESFINEVGENVVSQQQQQQQPQQKSPSGSAHTSFNSFFQKPSPNSNNVQDRSRALEEATFSTPSRPLPPTSSVSQKRYGDHIEEDAAQDSSVAKKPRMSAMEKAAPLAERMRPKTLDEVHGQSLVGPSGVLRGLVEMGRVPSMILWGGPGTGKTTIARLIAKTADKRFVEINSTSSGVAECKKLFAEAKNEMNLTGRGTIIFCDEIHRFSKSQQDVFLGPVEAGQVTLIGATTENPSFKVVNPLLSRCRTFTLAKLTDADIIAIMERALATLYPDESNVEQPALLDAAMLKYLAAFADGDARTALNLLDLAVDLSSRPSMTPDELKRSLTATLVYDRAGDQHYDTISAFHKSVRGCDPDATLYYLARMIQSGEDALYIARRMIVIASEDVGLASPHMLPLATAAYAAAEKIGLPEARINLAHCAVALTLAPKSTRVYRGLSNAMAACNEPGVSGLPIPFHLRNAPTRLMKELGYGSEYKYNPDYLEGKVQQTYLPDQLAGRRFLEDHDLGDKADPDLEPETSKTTREEDEKEHKVKLEPDGNDDENRLLRGQHQVKEESPQADGGIVFEDDFDKPDSSLPMDDVEHGAPLSPD